MIKVNDFCNAKKLEEINDLPLEKHEAAFEYFKNIYDESNKNLKQIGDNLFVLNLGLKSTDFIVFSIEDNKITAATQFKQTGILINNAEEFAYIPEFTISFGRKNFMELCYSSFSKLKNSYIMSDKKQTSYSKAIWKKWFNSYKNVFAYNIDTKKVIEWEDIEQSCCKDESCRKFRLVIKF